MTLDKKGMATLLAARDVLPRPLLFELLLSKGSAADMPELVAALPDDLRGAFRQWAGGLAEGGPILDPKGVFPRGADIRILARSVVDAAHTYVSHGVGSRTVVLHVVAAVGADWQRTTRRPSDLAAYNTQTRAVLDA